MSARPYLDVVPPVFNNCTELLDYNAETMARDLYWYQAQNERRISLEKLERGYQKVSRMNPYVAEPHVMLSQIFYKRGAFERAVHEAASALEIFYQWGTC